MTTDARPEAGSMGMQGGDGDRPRAETAATTHANGYHAGPVVPGRDPDAGAFSGRRVVLFGMVGVVAAAGLTWVGFLAWRREYLALAEYGRTEVAPRIDPMADRVPPGVAPEAWRMAVADTHAMLVALTGAGVLGRNQMEALGSEIAAKVAHATPETALADLSGLWDTLELRAGPVVSPDVTPARPGSAASLRNPRPPRPALLDKGRAASP